jgi:hypothetical protein
MTIQRRSRRTDLREGSLDINNLFVNAQLDSEGKIILPPEINAQEWLTYSVSFSELYEDSPPSIVSPDYIPEYQFDLPSEIATEPQSEGGSYLIRIYINGIKLNYGSDFSINQNICLFSLPYEIDSTDSIELWYVQA